MIIKCEDCVMWFDDEYRSTECPHRAFPANDGHNNFKAHDDAYLSSTPPVLTINEEAHGHHDEGPIRNDASGSAVWPIVETGTTGDYGSENQTPKGE